MKRKWKYLKGSQLQLKLTLGYSTSTAYPRAVEILKNLGKLKAAQVTSKGQGRALVFQLETSDPLGKAHGELSHLLNLCHNWHGSSLFFGDYPIRWAGFSPTILDSVEICRKNRDRSPDSYCQHGSITEGKQESFGCVRCSGVTRGRDYVRRDYDWQMPRMEHQPWWQYGQFENGKGKRFLVRKEDILSDLLKSAQCSGAMFCSHFRQERLAECVDQLPDFVSPDIDKNWTIVVRDGLPIGIAPAEREAPRNSFSIRLGFKDEEQPANVERNIPPTRYKDVKGQDPTLAQLREVIEYPIKHPEVYETLKLQGRKGVLLYGPPGNGKTLLAKAVAGECSAHLEIINGPEILSKWVGESESNLRKIFVRARNLAPSIVLIDEIDAVAPSRDVVSQDQHDVRLVSQLLVSMDGLESRGNVIVVATTNRLNGIDSALLRPGRFDYHVLVSPPDLDGRKHIIELYSSCRPLEHGIRFDVLAEQTQGYSGAELEMLCNEAALQAARRTISTQSRASSCIIRAKDYNTALQLIQERRTQQMVANKAL